MILGFWILDPLYSALGALLAWFYAAIPSYGIAIILLTVAVRLVTFPLTAKQAKSQQAMQRLQPEMKRLQAKYKNDRQKLNEEMMKFYKENKVNPFGGCLPLLIQMPILIVLYRLILDLSFTVVLGFTTVGATGTGALEGATVQGGQIARASMENNVVTKGKLEDARVSVGGTQVGVIDGASVSDSKVASAEVRNGPTLVGTLTNMQIQGGQLQGKPKHVPASSSLYAALAEDAGEMDWLGMDLSKSAATESGATQFPYLLLIALVIGTGYFQQKQMSARIPKDGANAQMQAVTKIFPIFFGVISYTIPAGVVVYFATSNIWQIGQQWFMFRKQPPIAAGPADKKTADGAKGSSGGRKALAGGSTSQKAGNPKGANPKAKGGGGSGKGAKQQQPRRSGAGQAGGKGGGRGTGRSNQSRNQAENKNKNPRSKDNSRKDKT